MTLEQMREAPDAVKAQMRKVTRRQLTLVTRQMLKPQPADRRAWLAGYIDFARKALEALS